jgi:hypothetical protein
MKHDKKVGYIQNNKELKPGDIIIFRSPKKIGLIHSVIMFMQSLIRQPRGHYDSTHVAICTEIKNEQPIITHLIGYGYKKEPLKTMLDEDGGDRAFIAYRPVDSIVANRIAVVSGDENKNKNIKWKVAAAISAFARKAFLAPRRKISNDKQLSQHSFCSKFAIEAIKVATCPRSNLPLESIVNYYPNINSSSTPKALESYLFRDKNYSMLVAPGKTNPYYLIKQEINAQINRISLRKDEASLKKYLLLKKSFKEFTEKMKGEENIDDLQKAISLLKAMSPILKINTGFNLSTSTSYKEVRDKARKIGIFTRDIEIDRGVPDAPGRRLQ